MTDRKHCGRLTDHDPHEWKGRGQSTVVTSDTTWERDTYPYIPHGPIIGPDYWCKGTIVVEGGHW